MLFVLFFLLLALAANAEVSWTFTKTQAEDITLDVSVGTPATTVPLQADVDSRYYFETDVEIPDVSIGGTYDWTKSSSFVFVATYFDDDGVTPIGVYGKEAFMIGGKTIESRPFAVRNDSLFQESYKKGQGSIGFGLPFDRSDLGGFVQSLLHDEPDKVITFAYDTVPYWNDTETSMTGFISIGGRQPERCSSNWTVWPTFDDDVWGPWVVDLTDVSTGKYTWAYEGEVVFSLTSPYFHFGETIYKPLLRSMGSTSYGRISCSYVEDLVYSIGGTEVHVAPADFIDYSNEKDGQCGFLGKETFCDDCFSLPISAVRGKCLMYDYANKQLGISDQL